MHARRIRFEYISKSTDSNSNETWKTMRGARLHDKRVNDFERKKFMIQWTTATESASD